MTRLLTEGAEFGDLLFWDYTSGAIVSSVTKRTGNFSYRVYSGYLSKNLSPAISELYLRFSYYVQDIHSAQSFCTLYKGANIIGKLRISSINQVEAYVGSTTLVFTSTQALQVNTHYLIEFHYKVDNSVGVIELKIDGLAQGSFNGDTQPGADTTIDNFKLGSSQSIYEFFDDIALNNILGSTDNSWCGNGRIELLKPMATGSSSQWYVFPTGTQNWTAVDEFPNDGDTTYVWSNVSGSVDMYQMTDFTGSNRLILRAWAEARAKDPAGGGMLQIGLRTYATNYWSTGSVLGTVYMPLLGPEYKTNPNTGVTWTQSELDAIEVGIKEIM